MTTTGWRCPRLTFARGGRVVVVVVVRRGVLRGVLRRVLLGRGAAAAGEAGEGFGESWVTLSGPLRLDWEDEVNGA